MFRKSYSLIIASCLWTAGACASAGDEQPDSLMMQGGDIALDLGTSYMSMPEDAAVGLLHIKRIYDDIKEWLNK